MTQAPRGYNDDSGRKNPLLARRSRQLGYQLTLPIGNRSIAGGYWNRCGGISSGSVTDRWSGGARWWWWWWWW